MDTKNSLRTFLTIQLLFLCESQLVSTETAATTMSCRPSKLLKVTADRM